MLVIKKSHQKRKTEKVENKDTRQQCPTCPELQSPNIVLNKESNNENSMCMEGYVKKSNRNRTKELNQQWEKQIFNPE